MNVFELNRGVIDQNADGEREAAQGHDVEGVAEQTQDRQRSQNRQRNRNHDDERAAPAAEKEQNHCGREQRGDDTFLHHAADRSADENRLIEQLGHLQSRRRRGAHSRKQRFDLIHDVESRCAAVLQDREQRRATAILADNIGLDGETVANMGDVADVNHRAVYLLDRDVVKRGDRVRAAVESDDEFALPDFGCASRQSQILRVDRVADVERRKAFGQAALADRDRP